MNTERPDNDDAARGPKDGPTPEDRGAPEDRGTPEDRGAPEAARAEETRAEATRSEDAPVEEADGAEPGQGEAARPAAGAGLEPSTEEPAEAPGPAPESVPEAEAETDSETEAEKPAAAAVLGHSSDTAGGSPGDDADHADHAPEGGRRRSSVLVASVAAAVLVVGGGGAYLAASAGGGTDGSAGAPSSGGSTPPALVLDDYAAASEPGNGIAPGEPNPYGVTYRADGALPDGPASASVYWAKGEVTRAEVARLAGALGVEGTPVTEGQAWKVGSGKDGSGPVLRVEKGAPGLWTFSRYAPGTDNCKSGSAVCTPEATTTSVDPVSEAAAKKAAAPVLKAVGQDDAKIDASQVMGAQRIVNADARVDGLPTYGWTTGVTVSAQGEIVGGNGQVKAPAEGETYPVLGAQETLDRMNAAPGADRRVGIGGCATPVPAEDQVDSSCETSAGAPQKETLTVEDAVFGLAPHASGGRQVLVPSWLFSVRATGAGDDYTVTHPAVEPEFLNAPPAATPSGAPTSGTETRDVTVDGYTAEGRELVVGFTGGVCSDYTAKAVESEGQVKVTVTEKPWPDAVCIKIAKFFHRTVQLDEPLGDRKVVGSDGKQVPLEKPGARLPR
ncbi:hypothetical protein ACKI10_08815 [Streptomyces galilaeus]|uniref:hypothetical protein n=1 Tax=Streptomyces galilaeus TaxID=33899 RepID=UPI0038F5E43C